MENAMARGLQLEEAGFECALAYARLAGDVEAAELLADNLADHRAFALAVFPDYVSLEAAQ